jgi:hypothetical protein
MLRTGARLGQQHDDILQRLPNLTREALIGKASRLVPTNLPGEIHLSTPRYDAVRIAFGSRPTGRLQQLVHRITSRAMINF